MSIPPYFLRHLYNVVFAIPCLRHNSKMPLPASASPRIPMICSSVKRFRFMTSSRPLSQLHFQLRFEPVFEEQVRVICAFRSCPIGMHQASRRGAQ